MEKPTKIKLCDGHPCRFSDNCGMDMRNKAIDEMDAYWKESLPDETEILNICMRYLKQKHFVNSVCIHEDDLEDLAVALSKRFKET